MGTACSAEADAYDVACNFSGCGGEVGGASESCELQQECDDSLQRYVCEDATCTCIEDGVPGAQCPADQFCESSDEERRAAITACCGWTWVI